MGDMGEEIAKSLLKGMLLIMAAIALVGYGIYFLIEKYL